MKISIVAVLGLSSAATLVNANLPGAVVNQCRRLLNFGSLLGSQHSVAKTPYEKVLGAPVFQVTTPWGSAYMSMEKLTDMDESSPPDASSVVGNKNPNQLRSISEENNEYRTVAVYYMDPDDALAAHAELKQLEQMQDADIRITSTSLGKALRSSANLGKGLVTGLPIDTSTGSLKSVEEGGSLRHKVVPPKRQLFYAARCIGKERVGLFSENPNEEAASAVIGNAALESLNIMRRREKRERKGAPRAKTPIQAQNAHMEGYTGIPVFWAQGMQRQQPKLKQLLSGNRMETPLFLNYEDLQDAWGKMKKRKPDLPEEPTVEVFNLWDVLTSMDKDAWREKKRKNSKMDWSKPLLKRVVGSKEAPGIDSVVFIPSSASIDYKETISARGNGKARLRPMR